MSVFAVRKGLGAASPFRLARTAAAASLAVSLVVLALPALHIPFESRGAIGPGLDAQNVEEGGQSALLAVQGLNSRDRPIAPATPGHASAPPAEAIDVPGHINASEETRGPTGEASPEIGSTGATEAPEEGPVAASGTRSVVIPFPPLQPAERPAQSEGTVVRAIAHEVVSAPAAADVLTAPPAAALWESINQARLLAGSPPLVLDASLNRVATERAEELAGGAYFGHREPSGRRPYVDLLAGAGYTAYLWAGENLASVPGELVEAPGLAFRGFMGSPPHRKNLEDSDFREVGIGFARGPEFVYVVVIFLG